MNTGLVRLFVFLLVLLAGHVACHTASAQPQQNAAVATPATTLGFERGGYWLVNPAPADITLHSDAREKLHLALYRLIDPELLTKVMTARAARSLGEAELLRRVADGTRPIWQGDVLPDNAVMQVPLDILAGQNGLPLGNGVYVLTAGLKDAHATQWFMRTSTDLAVRFYGRHALVTLYDMTTRQPRIGVPLTWLDAAGKKLAEPVATDTNGTAWLDRPQGMNGVGSPVLLMAAGQDPTFATVPAGASPSIDRALILPDSDQVMPVVSSLFIAPNYKLADLQARLAGKDIELTQVAGSIFKATGAVPPEMQNGSVALELFHDDQLLARHTLAQGSNPDLSIDWQQKPASIIGTAKQTYKFRLLQNGKPLASKAGQLTISAIAGADLDDAPVPNAEPSSLPFTTDRNGLATVMLDPATLGWLTETAPSYATLAVTLADAPVGARTLLSLYPARNWLEITPGFANNAVAEGATARFTARLGSPDQKNRDHAAALDWQLARETYKFEWYQADDGRWTYRTKTTLVPAANGKAAFTRNNKDDAASIAVPVGAGRYRLTVTDAANRLTASMGFTAGWWLAPVPTSTPERIELKAQMETDTSGKPRMAVFVDPPFAGRVWLTATTSVGTRTIMADVPDEGTFVYIDQPDLPAGQPLTLNAFALPTKPNSVLVQALGSLTLPVGLPVNITPATVSTHQPTALTVDGLMASTRAIVQLLDDDNNVVYTTALLDVTAGALHVIVPPLAIGDGAITARLIATDDNQVSSVTDKRLANDGDITLDAPAIATDALAVTILTTKNITDKMRLTLMGAEAATTPVAPLKAGKPVTVKLPVTALKPGQKDLLLRLESHDGTIIAARPLRLLVK